MMKRKQIVKKWIAAMICGAMLIAPASAVCAEENTAMETGAEDSVSMAEEMAALEEYIPAEDMAFIAAEEVTLEDAAYEQAESIDAGQQGLEQYRIHFEVFGMAEGVEDVYAVYGSLIAKPNVPEVAGMVLEGWYKDAEYTTPWNFETDVVAEDIVLYAKWNTVEEEQPVDAEQEVAGVVSVQEETEPVNEAKVIETEEAVEAEADELTLFAAANDSVPTVSYRTHVQRIGWQGYVKNGETAGTTGQSLRLEGINIKLSDTSVKGNIEYRTHVQTYGWQGWVANDAMAGTKGESKRLEAIQIRLTGDLANKYDIWYQTHVQHFGWTGWAKNGECCGSAGYGYRLEGIKIIVKKKGQAAPGNLNGIYYEKNNATTNGSDYYKGTLVRYNTHVQTYGWQNFVTDGAMAGTSGQSKRLEGIRIALTDVPYSGNIEYRTHVQTYGWQGWVSNGAMAGTSGESKRLEAIQIKLSGDIANYYDVYYKVHAQTYGWLDWARNGQMAGTAGLSKRLEGIYIKLVKKGQSAPGNTGNPFVSSTPMANPVLVDKNPPTQNKPQNGNTNSNTGGNANAGSGTAQQQNSNTNNNTSSNKPVCTHTNLTPVYKYIKRTDTKEVIDSKPYDTLKCNVCGFEGHSPEQSACHIIHDAMYKQFLKKDPSITLQQFEAYYKKNYEAHAWEYAREIANDIFNVRYSQILTEMLGENYDDLELHIASVAYNTGETELIFHAALNGHSWYNTTIAGKAHKETITYEDKILDYYNCSDCGATHVKDGSKKVISTQIISVQKSEPYEIWE